MAADGQKRLRRPLLTAPARRAPRRSSGPRRFRVARRPAAPAFWTNIAPALRAAQANPEPGATPVPSPAPNAKLLRLDERERCWLLVLEAKGIARAVFGRKEKLSLYVPPVAAAAALREIRAFEQERPETPLPELEAKPLAYWVMAFIALLLVWHQVRWAGSPHASFMPGDPQEWLRLGGLDAYRVKIVHEWWRCLTALTMHADEAHLIGNVVTGSLFCLPLCRRVGLGMGVLLTVLAGALGNAATVLFRPASFLSQGFSTAVFAAVGLLAAVTACHVFQHTLGVTRAVSGKHTIKRTALHKALKRAIFAALLPLGAGLGLLAMLGGSDAPRVDYLAHVMGLFCGMALGLGLGSFAPWIFRLKGHADTALQTACLLTVLGLLALAWRYALA